MPKHGSHEDTNEIRADLSDLTDNAAAPIDEWVDSVGRAASVEKHAVTFSYAAPPQSHTSTSGGSTLNYNDYGVRLDVGGTSGDTAEAHGSIRFVAGAAEYSKVLIQWGFYTGSGTPTTDDIIMGTLIPGVYSSTHASLVGYCPTTEEWAVGGTTTAGPSLSSNTSYRMAAMVDYTNNETKFYLNGNHDATISKTNYVRGGLGMNFQSNGAGDHMDYRGGQQVIFR